MLVFINKIKKRLLLFLFFYEKKVMDVYILFVNVFIVEKELLSCNRSYNFEWRIVLTFQEGLDIQGIHS